MSHVLDLVAEQRQRPLAQHGTQVALATLLTTGAYQIFFEEFEPEEVNLENCYPTEGQMQARIEAAFHSLDPSGRVAAECWSDYKIKLEAWHAHRADFEHALRDWPDIQAKLQSAGQTAAGCREYFACNFIPSRISPSSPLPPRS